MGAVTLIYTYIGGVKSVIWNDCVQFVIYIAGACIALYEIINSLSGGLEGFQAFAAEANKLRVFDFEFSLVKPSMTFWAGLIGGAFLTMATHGTDQLTVQRLLTARSQRGAAVALVASGIVVCLQFALFLVIGVALAAFFHEYPPDAAVKLNKDHAFAYYIVHHLRPGLIGLTLAAVFSAAMSTLSGSLNSSATALVSDLIIPLRRMPLTESAQLKLSRIATGFFGLVQIGIALASYWRDADQSVVESVLTIAAFTSGPMLGLYLLAVLTPRVSERVALTAFVLGLALLAFVQFSAWPNWPWKAIRWPWEPIYWPWYAAIGSLGTFSIGYVLSWTPLNDAIPENSTNNLDSA
jgi:Na+/proline symporter